MAAPVLTDHSVPWTSTVPANKDKPATLFVRKRNGTKPNKPREPVLMLHGRSVPALAGFDLQHGKYGWAEFLADAGYDVFVMDLQESGRSTRAIHVPAPGVPEGVMRVKNPYWWGWNSTTVPLDGILGSDIPVLIIYGDLDSTANTPADLGLLHFSVPALYNAMPGTRKMMFRIACAGHQIPWERRAKTVHNMSRQWLQDNIVEDLEKGSLFLDEDGVITPLD